VNKLVVRSYAEGDLYKSANHMLGSLLWTFEIACTLELVNHTPSQTDAMTRFYCSLYLLCILELGTVLVQFLYYYDKL